MSPYLIASLAVNFVLVVLLFFRGAINDVVKQLFRSKYEAKHSRLSLLRQLHAKLEDLPKYYFLWLAAAVLVMKTANPLEQAEAQERADNNFRELDRINTFIREHRLEFSEPIQKLLDDLSGAVYVGVVGCFKPNLGLADPKFEQVGLVVEKLKDAIRNELR